MLGHLRMFVIKEKETVVAQKLLFLPVRFSSKSYRIFFITIVSCYFVWRIAWGICYLVEENKICAYILSGFVLRDFSVLGFVVSPGRVWIRHRTS